MYAVISTVDRSALVMVARIRSWLSGQCSYQKMPRGLTPHLSWQGAQDYPLKKVEEVMQDLAQSLKPVTLRVSGFGIFSGKEPVVYLPVPRPAEIAQIHQTLWNSLSPLAEGLNDYFSPQIWIPHISIFYGDEETLESLTCALGKLTGTEIRFDITLDHFSIAFVKNGKYGTRKRFYFKG